MYYRVRGRFREGTAAEFRRLLRNGTIARQRPDGQEIVESMERAVITRGGVVEWSQVCYCPTPLQHERATVYDRFFDDIATDRVEEYPPQEGRSFRAHLDELADAAERRPGPADPARG